MIDRKNLRLFFGLTLDDIAKAAGVTKGCVFRYEKGDYKSSKCDEVYTCDMFRKIRNSKYQCTVEGMLTNEEFDKAIGYKEK